MPAIAGHRSARAGIRYGTVCKWPMGDIRAILRGRGHKGVVPMAFSVSTNHPFRSLRRYTGKHEAPKGPVPEPRAAAEDSESGPQAHRPAHAATQPRLTGPHGTP